MNETGKLKVFDIWKDVSHRELLNEVVRLTALLDAVYNGAKAITYMLSIESHL